jgi:hypothetical protein
VIAEDGCCETGGADCIDEYMKAENDAATRIPLHTGYGMDTACGITMSTGGGAHEMAWEVEKIVVLMQSVSAPARMHGLRTITQMVRQLVVDGDTDLGLGTLLRAPGVLPG